MGHNQKDSVYFWFQQLHRDASRWAQNWKDGRVCDAFQCCRGQLGQTFSFPICKFLLIQAQEINNYRKYDFSSMRDLVRMIRNKLNHFHEIPKEVRAYVGKTPEKFMEYCLIKFPKLLYFAYNYTRKKKWRLHVKWSLRLMVTRYKLPALIIFV